MSDFKAILSSNSKVRGNKEKCATRGYACKIGSISTVIMSHRTTSYWTLRLLTANRQANDSKPLISLQTIHYQLSGRYSTRLLTGPNGKSQESTYSQDLLMTRNTRRWVKFRAVIQICENGSSHHIVQIWPQWSSTEVLINWHKHQFRSLVLKFGNYGNSKHFENKFPI
jgi:hypothetical protein